MVGYQLLNLVFFFHALASGRYLQADVPCPIEHHRPVMVDGYTVGPVMIL